MDCVVTPLKTLMGFSVHLNVQLKFYNLPILKPDGYRQFNTAYVEIPKKQGKSEIAAAISSAQAKTGRSTLRNA